MTTEPTHHELLIAGFGGQGVVLAGRLLAMAALAEGREVVWAPSYGPEMRGGPVHCTVIVSSDRIGSPEVTLADGLVIMDRASFDRLSHRVKPGGLLIFNSSLIFGPDGTGLPAGREGGVPDASLLPIPANQAAEDLGNLRVANVIMLGALLARCPVVSIAALEDAIREEGRSLGEKADRLIAINLKALERGRELAEETTDR